MVRIKNFQFRGNVNVACCAPEGELEPLNELVASSDFQTEIDEIRRRAGNPANTLLVYDRIIATAAYSDNSGISCRVLPMHQDHVIESIDSALSAQGEPIRIVDKTSSPSGFLDNLAVRLDLGWIRYNPASQLMDENPKKPCIAKAYIDEMAPNKDLYAISQSDGCVLVTHLHIEEKPVSLACGTKSIEFFPEARPRDVVAMLMANYPDSLVLEEPLSYCSNIRRNGSSCLADIFRDAYCAKTDFNRRKEANIRTVIGTIHPYTN